MRQTTGIILLEFLTGAVLLVGMLFGLLAWRLLSGPTDLGFLKADVEAAIERAREGRQVEIGELRLLWLSEESRFQIQADDVRLYGEQGENVVTAEQAVIGINAIASLSGDFKLSELILETGELVILRTAEGQISIADHVIPPVYPVQHHEASTPVQYVEQSILNIIDNISQSEAIRELDRVRLRDFTVYLIDEGLDVEWSLERATLDVEREDSSVQISAAGQVFGEGAPETAEMDAELNLENRSFSTRIAFLQQSLPDFPLLDWLPVDVSGRVLSDIVIQFDADASGIALLTASVNALSGTLNVADQALELGQNDISLLYDVRGNQFEIDARAFDIGPLQGSALIQMPDANDWIESPLRRAHPVTLSLPDVGADFRPYFEAPWRAGNVEVDGMLDLDAMTFIASDLRLNIDDATISGKGEVYLADPDRPETDLPFGARVTAQTSGNVSPEQVLRFWPVSLGEGARNWVAENVHQGRMFDARFEMDFQPDSLREDYLRDEVLTLDFSFADAEVGFLSDIPHIKSGSGTAQLKGNSFSLDLTRAMFEGWELETGLVQLPAFKPKGSIMSVRASGQGEIQNIIKMLSNSRLQLEKQYGLDVEALTGDGRGVFTLRRPLLDDVSYEETRFNFSGDVRNASFRRAISGLDLTNASAAVVVDNSVLEIVGGGQLAQEPISFEWTDRFLDETEDRMQVSARGSVTPDLLNRFGLAVRAYVSGDIATTVSATGQSLSDLSEVDVDFDLTPNRLDLSELGWIKERGEPAEANLTYRARNGRSRTNIRLESEGFEFDGDVQLDSSDLLSRVRLQRLFLEGQMDVSGSLERTPDTGLNIEISGPYLNGAPFIDAMNLSGDPGAVVFGDVVLTSRLDRLTLRDGFELTDVDLDLEFAGPDLQSLALTGITPVGGDMDIQLTSSEDRTRRIRADVGNAGELIQGIFGTDFVTGGRLTAEGTLRPGGEPADLMVIVSGARLRDAPLLPQILSLASLRGLADVMSGEGILFSSIEIPLRIDDRGFYLNGMKASGPAMGMTASGHVLDDGANIALDGVLVPSFGMNSALGGIPIIGDLFVSRDGEGVFAITYDVRGSFEEARVSVNPLSGLLPGVLRRIFENPADIPELETEGEPDSAPSE